MSSHACIESRSSHRQFHADNIMSICMRMIAIDAANDPISKCIPSEQVHVAYQARTELMYIGVFTCHASFTKVYFIYMYMLYRMH